jgi:tetratricopeptide (TPR) repeat protein
MKRLRPAPSLLRLKPLLRIVAASVLLLAPARPCAPEYDDAHHGLQDPLRVRLEDFARGLYPDLPADPRALVERARTAEANAQWPQAIALWQQVHAGLGGAQDPVGLGREARIHLVCLPRIGSTITANAWQSHLAGDDQAVPDAGHLRRGEALLRAGDLAAGSAELAAIPDTSPLAAEAGFLRAAGPVLAAIKAQGRVADPVGVVANLGAWRAQHPGDPRLAEALGWEGFIHFHAGNPAEAVRVYETILADAGLRHAFGIQAIASLRYAWRPLRPAPPAWAVADPRHAVAFLWHALTDHVPADSLAFAPLAQAVAAYDPTQLPPGCSLRLAQTLILTNALPDALRFARAAHAALPASADATYLVARLAPSTETLALAETLAAAKDPRASDLFLRSGAAAQSAGKWADALHAYIRAGSLYDLNVATDGEVPLPDLIAFVASNTPQIVACGDRAGEDLRIHVRNRCAVRLARHGRLAEAKALFSDDRQGLCAQLEILQDAVATAAKEQQPARLLALATWWYGSSKRLIVNGLEWHQFAMSGREVGDVRSPAAQELLAMTPYHRAYPFFLALAERFPSSPEAPVALYHAALCRYWLTAKTMLGTSGWWEEYARQEDYTGQGDALLVRLARTYPQHPLARDPKVLRALDKLAAKGL